MSQSKQGYAKNPSEQQQGPQMPASEYAPWPSALLGPPQQTANYQQQGPQMPASEYAPWPSALLGAPRQAANYQYQGPQMPASEYAPWPSALGVPQQIFRSPLANPIQSQTAGELQKSQLETCKKKLEQAAQNTAEFGRRVEEALTETDRRLEELEAEPKIEENV